MEKKIHYGNWISNGLMVRCLAMGTAFALLSAITWIIWDGVALGIVFSVLAAFFFASFIYFIRARRMFSNEGGGIQNRIIGMLVDHVRFDGKGTAIDIGCGSGALSVGIAKRFTDAKVTGVDYWGKAWEFSQKQCETYAEAEGVGGRTAFQRGDASQLPFEDESFDLAVSNLVFHEVKCARNKRDLVLEALRVVRKGGVFAFQDLFRLEPYYGKMDDFLKALKEAGISEVHYEDTSDAPFIPKMLKLPFMVGTLGILYGIK